MKIKPDIFLTSDTHFGHTRLWQEWGRKENFEEIIIENWNKLVKKDDIVLHLGDLSLANKEKTKFWTSRLNGRKYLIRGNHDSNSDSWYKECGFDTIPNALKHFGLKDDTYMKVLFTHIPEPNLPEGWFNVHGHLHGDKHRGEAPNKIQYYDVGVDACDFKPIRLWQVLGELKNG